MTDQNRQMVIVMPREVFHERYQQLQEDLDKGSGAVCRKIQEIKDLYRCFIVDMDTAKTFNKTNFLSRSVFEDGLTVRYDISDDAKKLISKLEGLAEEYRELAIRRFWGDYEQIESIENEVSIEGNDYLFTT